METEICYIDEEDKDKIIKAAKIIKNGGIVAFPTETVYGLGASAIDTNAVSKIFEAKGRPQDNPLIVHVADFDIYKYVKEVPLKAKLLMDAFWPGPLTIIMKKSDLIPEKVTAGLDSVGLRMPENKIARTLIQYAGVPIAAPSANISGKPSPTSIEHCIEDLNGKVDMIIGGGRCSVGIESTVVDATSEDIIILRPGAITEEMICEVAGSTSIDPAVMKKPDKNLKPKAPGMKYRHYAPKAPMVVVIGEEEEVIKYINDKIRVHYKKGQRAGVMAVEETIERYDASFKVSLGTKKNPGIIAANLFDCLREFDKIDVDYIYSEGFSEEGIGLAIMNRLKKAAGFNILQL